MPTLRPNVVRFVILFPGRTGSTYLVSALDSHPKIDAKGEMLARLRPDGAAVQLDWVRRFLRGPVVNRHAVVGFKTKLRDVLDHDAFAAALTDADARVIFLDRRNDVKHAISRITARMRNEATGRWNRYADGEKLDPFAVEPHDLERLLGKVQSDKAAITEFVDRLDRPLLHVDYEDLLTDSADTFNSVLSFVGLDSAPLEGSTLKNTSDDLRETVVNFDELRTLYVGTPYEQMFDEVLVTDR